MASNYDTVHATGVQGESEKDMDIVLAIGENPRKQVGTLKATHIGDGTVRLHELELEHDFLHTALQEYVPESLCQLIHNTWSSASGRTYLFMRVSEEQRVPIGTAWAKHGFRVSHNNLDETSNSILISGSIVTGENK